MLRSRLAQVARQMGLAVLWAGLAFGNGLAAADEPGSKPPYPVWWSPVLELDSLEGIDARLRRALWPGNDEGMTVYKPEGDTRLEVQAKSCNELKRLEMSRSMLKS